jgi:hypothetical protein
MDDRESKTLRLELKASADECNSKTSFAEATLESLDLKNSVTEFNPRLDRLTVTDLAIFLHRVKQYPELEAELARTKSLLDEANAEIDLNKTRQSKALAVDEDTASRLDAALKALSDLVLGVKQSYDTWAKTVHEKGLSPFLEVLQQQAPMEGVDQKWKEVTAFIENLNAAADPRSG